MKILSLFALISLLFASPAFAIDAREVNKMPHCTVANLSTCAVGEAQGRMGWITDAASATDCSVGGGTFQHACIRNENGAWDVMLPPGAVAPVFNVVSYGAVADAVAATGGSGCNNLTTPPVDNDASCTASGVPLACCTGDEAGTCTSTCTAIGLGTNNTVAFQAAWTAACAAGGGTVFTPCGSYRVGGPYASNFVEPSASCAGVRWIGEGAECTKIYIGTTGNGRIFSSSTAGVTTSTGLEIAHMTFLDDDTESRGHGYIILDDGTVTSSNASCIGVDDPLDCCTGVGTGSCTGPISGFTNYNSTIPGTTLVADVGHGLIGGEYVEIVGDGGDDELDGYYWVAKVSANAFFIEIPYDATPASGNWYVRPAVGDDVTWTGGYDGVVSRWDPTLGILRVSGDEWDVDLIDNPGTDDITSGFWIASNVGGTIFDIATNEESHGLNFGDCDDCSLHDCTFQNLGDESVNVARADNFRMYNVTFKDTPWTAGGGSAINVGVDTTNSSIKDNTFYGGVRGRGGDAIAIEVNASPGLSGLIIEGNFFFDSSTEQQDLLKTGIRLHPYGASIDDVLITDNIFDFGAVNTAIYQSGNTNPINRLTIRDNEIINGSIDLVRGNLTKLLIEDNTLDGSGIIGEASLLSAKAMRLKGAAWVNDNRVYSFPNVCAEFVTAGAGKVRVTDNDCIGTAWVNGADAAIYFNSATAADPAIVTGNYLVGAYSPSTTSAIDCNGIPDSFIENNTIVAPDSFGIRDCSRIMGNAIDMTDSADGADCINVANLDHPEISDNTCIATVQDGIVVSSTLYATIKDNVIRGMVTTAEAIDEEGTAMFTHCEGNRSVSESCFTVSSTTNMDVGDDVQALVAGCTGADTHDGYIVSISGTTVCWVPDDFSDDGDLNADTHDLENNGGDAWTSLNVATTADQWAAMQPNDIDCSGTGSAEANNEYVPIP